MSNIKRASIYIILIISLLASLYYGFQKQGFHEDEYYTYYSSNRSLGLYEPDRQWQDRQTILDEYVVKKGEGFNYGLVKLVQSWDVHPPVYYMIFHTICSLVPGVFTKWTGIITNLIAFVISFFALRALMKRLAVPYYVQIITLIFWGLNPQTISCNMLVRMYAWLTAAVFLCAYTHISVMQDYERYKNSPKQFFVRLMLPVMVVSYVGFLIQYFYIFFFVSIGFSLAVWMFFYKKDIYNTIIYVVSCIVSMGLAVLTYPASLHHMFGGYRGSDAAGSLFDIKNTVARISFFIGLLNDYVFAGGLLIAALLLVMAIMALMIKNKKHKKIRPEAVILAIGTISYFLLTAKSALLVGSASNRYEMPIYGLIILLVFWDIYYVFDAADNKTYLYAFTAAMAAFLLKGLIVDGNVLFLYREDAAKIEYAADNSDSVSIVMYNPATPYNVWRLTDELLQYDKVFYMNEENPEPIEDEIIKNSDKIILYVADNPCQEDAIKNLQSACQNIGTRTYISSEDMWTTYEFN